MDPIERELRAAKRSRPSPALDRRVEAAFAAARRRSRTRTSPWPWLWLATFAGTGIAAVLFIVLARPGSPAARPSGLVASAPQSPADVYTFEAEGRLREMLLDPAARRHGPPEFLPEPNAIGTPQL